MPDNRENILEELKEVLLGAIDIDPEDLTLDAHFFKDLGVDSIKAIEITVAIERHFKVSIRDENVARVTTLGQVFEVLMAALEEKGE